MQRIAFFVSQLPLHSLERKTGCDNVAAGVVETLGTVHQPKESDKCVHMNKMIYSNSHIDCIQHWWHVLRFLLVLIPSVKTWQFTEPKIT